MIKKMESAIRKINLDRATFKNTGTTVVPTYINFFFGRNGSGKSTLAKAIDDDEGIVWSDGENRVRYDVLVYNQEFIDRNFSEYGDLPGVVTLHEHNIEIQQQLEQKKNEKARLEEIIRRLQKELYEKTISKDAVNTQFQKLCWNQTLKVREDFKDALKGKLKSQQFMDGVLSIPNAVDHDYDKLKNLYNIAFSFDSRTYRAFEKIDKASTYGTLPGSKLLDKSIVSSSDSSFAQFIKALSATDWVRHGYDHYSFHTFGKCPYCQQKLPADFDAEIAACFDAQYQKDIEDLRSFETMYKRETTAVIDKLSGNVNDTLPTLDLMEYKDKLDLLESKIRINVQRIENKIKEPTTIISLEDTDSILLDLGMIIDDINKQIAANNSIVNDKRKKKEQCKKDVWEMIAFMLKDQIIDYSTTHASLDSEISSIREMIVSAQKDCHRIISEIRELNKHGVNTEQAIESINYLLRDSGFRGFELRPKAGVKNTYEVIHPDGQVAKCLSDGERNFIAFLYFYQLVQGNGKVDGTSNDGKIEVTDARDKIVVIDDPVSSMDSNALFVVSSIVRDMIRVCYNNIKCSQNETREDYIKQIFIMTHNTHFHSKITYREVSHYRSTSFYVIHKVDNHSSIVNCVRPSLVKGEEENYNPVQNSYAALWDELKKLYNDDRTSIAIKNVSRRIIDQYFLQFCGFDETDLRRIVLEESKVKFVNKDEYGKYNYEKYHVASTLINCVRSRSDMDDDVFIDDECVNGDTHRIVLRLIFESMGHDQHYKMMMGECL